MQAKIIVIQRMITVMAYDKSNMIQKLIIITMIRITAKSMKTKVKINQENNTNNETHNLKKRLAS